MIVLRAKDGRKFLKSKFKQRVNDKIQKLMIKIIDLVG
jgi:hypothetical protein